MDNESTVKVLWIDNDLSIVESTQQWADNYNIELIHCKNWDEGETELRNQFDKLSAIILDANCEFHHNSVEDKSFLAFVMPRMAKLFGEKHHDLPWYVLSAGTMEDFNLVMQLVDTDDRQQHDSNWGRLLYLKDKRNEDGTTDLDALFANIRKAVKNSGDMKIRSYYSDVFNALDNSANKYDPALSDIVLEVLKQLHHPEQPPTFKPINYFMQLRRAAEFIFRAANEHGLLPDQCLHDGKINLKESWRYMSGQDTKYSGVKFANGKGILPRLASENLGNMMEVANNSAHTDSADVEEEDLVGSLFEVAGAWRQLCAFTLELCDLIVWLGNYMAIHNDREQNLRNIQSIPTEQERIYNRKRDQGAIPQKGGNNKGNYNRNGYTPANVRSEYSSAPEKYEGQIMRVEMDKNGNWHCEGCLINANGIRLQKGDFLQLEDIVSNIKETRYAYPLFARRFSKLRM